jgi:manganese/zinc/iron transport system permease protein
MIGELASWLGIAYATLVVTAGVSLLGAGLGLVGCFAVLRRRALTGDVLAHAALPGVGLAFIVVGSRYLPALLTGAFLTGLLGVLVISGLRGYTRVKEDAALGIVLSVFFGAGVVILRVIQTHYRGTGETTHAGLGNYYLGQAATMLEEEVYLIAAVSLACLAAVLLLYKEFRLVAFDGDFARVQGWPALALDLVLMGLVALAVVVGLPAVGVVLTAALLILPGAAARFWTERLGTMLALAVAFGVCMGAAGAFVSDRYSGMPTGPVIVLAGAVVFVASGIVAPRRGLVGRALAHFRFRRQLDEGNLLRAVYELSEPHLPHAAALSLDDILRERAWAPRRLRRLLAAAVRQRLLEQDGDAYALTPAGLRRAAEIVRGQRLWEMFLNEYPDQAQGVVNLAGASVDDLLPPQLVEELSARLAEAGRMPRGNGPAGEGAPP